MKDRVIHNEKGNHLLAFFVVYTLSVFIYKDFEIPTIVGYVVLGCFFIIALKKTNFAISVNNFKMTFLSFSAIQIAEIILSLIITGNKSDANLALTLLVCTIILFIAHPTGREIKMVINIWLFLSSLLAAYVIAVFIKPDLYYNFVAGLLSPESARRNASLLSKGYGIIIGSNLELIDYILAFAFFYALNVFLVEGMQNHKKVFRYLLLAILLLTGIVLENKKAETLVTLVVAAFLVVSKFNYRSFITRLRLRIAFLFASLFGASFLLIMYKREKLGRYGMLLDAVFSRSSLGSDVTSGRLKLWSVAIDLFTKHPILGIGWGEYEKYVPEDVSFYAELKIRHTHNCVLQLLCETGIVGLLLYIVPLIMLVAYCFRVVNRIRNDRGDNYLLIVSSACVAYQLYFILEGLINPTWYKMVCLMLMTISFIIVDACNREHKNEYIKREE